MNDHLALAPRRRGDAGIVTVEAALLLPVLFVVLTLMSAVIITLHAKVMVLDASREAARLAARGETTAVAVSAGERLGPRGATVTVRDRSHWVEAEVRATVHPFGPLPGFTLRASTLAERETP